ncbi:MAG: hypothetical protein JXR37_04115 [Kiritimatiellae bacterium]|nr:hypothetical protein [Kiritimatiellia bacterium]
MRRHTPALVPMLLAACLLRPAPAVFADTHYVATNGTPVSPYTNWPSAALQTQDAVAVAGCGRPVLQGRAKRLRRLHRAVNGAATAAAMENPRWSS